MLAPDVKQLQIISVLMVTTRSKALEKTYDVRLGILLTVSHACFEVLVVWHQHYSILAHVITQEVVTQTGSRLLQCAPMCVCFACLY